MCEETVKDGSDSLNACVWICWRWGSLWDWNGLSWKRFVENQCGGRRGRGGKPDLVGKGGWGRRATDGTLLSIKGICPVHLLDGCGLVLGRGGAEKIVGRGVWKEGMCQRLVLE